MRDGEGKKTSAAGIARASKAEEQAYKEQMRTKWQVQPGKCSRPLRRSGASPGSGCESGGLLLAARVRFASSQHVNSMERKHHLKIT